MPQQVVVYNDRRTVVQVNLGVDVSSDVITSEIRSSTGALLAAWDVEFLTDGVDGKLLFVLDDSQADMIQNITGVMDIKRVHSGEPRPVLRCPLTVLFQKAVTQ